MSSCRINEKSYEEQLKMIPSELEEVCIRLNKAKFELDKAESQLEDFCHTLSANITVNPNKYGFLLGDKPERFRILARVKSNPEYQKLNNTVLYHRNQVRIETENKEIIKIKFEALRCLLT